MRKLWLPFLLVFVVSAIAGAQTIIESATAAAGGSAAGVAGKRVGEGLDAVLGKVSDMAKKGATADDGKKPRKLAPAIPPVPEVRIKEVGKDASAKAKPGTPAAHRQANLQAPTAAPAPETQTTPTIEAVPAAPAAPQAPPPPPVPTSDDLRALSGASRDEVMSKMGKPASRITMSDESGLVEVMSFRNQNGTLGSVRVVNGKVTEVKTPQ